MDSAALDSVLAELKITVGTKLSKSRKAHELNKAIKQLNSDEHAMMPPQSQDKDALLFQTLQNMQANLRQCNHR